MPEAKPILPHQRLIVGLDTSDRDGALRLVEGLHGRVGCFKVGLQLFTSLGPSIVSDIVASGEQVFLDLKYHDIPNTAAHAVREASRLGAAFTDVHVSGGEAMLRAAAEAREAAPVSRPRTILLGVTILTSLDAAAAREVGYDGELSDTVIRLALLA